MAKKKEEVDDLIEEVEVKDKKQYYTIEEHDFKMESTNSNDIRFFDLYFMHIVNKGKENERQEFKLDGYGYQLKTCLRKIAVMRAGNSSQKEFKSFKEFVQVYLKQVAEVQKLFDMLPNSDD